MLRVPASIWCFVITGIVFVLQLVPTTGIHLYYRGAPFWSVITINLGFGLMAVEALVGRIPRALLVVPSLYVAGYATATIVSHVQLAHLRREIAAENASAHLRYDPSRDAFVIKISDESSMPGVTGFVLARYDVPAVFYSSDVDRANGYSSARVVGRATCDRAKAIPGAARAGVSATPLLDGSRTVPGLCTLRLPEAPRQPAVLVKAKESLRSDRLLQVRETVVTITNGQGESAALRGGHAFPLSWLPAPVLGCGLDSGRAAWRCLAAFNSSEALIDPGFDLHGQDYKAIAATLGLTPSPVAARIDPNSDNPEARRQLELFEDAQLGREQVRMTALLDDPAAWRPDPGVDPFPLLSRRPDLLAGEADRLADALRRAMPGLNETRYARLVIAALIARLPPEAYQAIAPALLDVVRTDPAARPADKLIIEAGFFVERLGDIEAARPLLYDALLDPARDDWQLAWPILAVCRVGSGVPDDVSSRIIAVLRSTSRTLDPELHAAAFVALLRFGLSDIALADPPQGPGTTTRWYGDLVAEVTPSSPPSACTAGHRGRTELL